jgi:hypothetical protein
VNFILSVSCFSENFEELREVQDVWNDDKAYRGWLRNGRSDMLSPPFKVAADLQATAEQSQTGGLVSTRGELADPVGTRRLNWIYRAFTAIVTIGCWEPVAWTLCNSVLPPAGCILYYDSRAWLLELSCRGFRTRASEKDQTCL